MYSDDEKEKLLKIARLWDQVEGRLKEAEIIRGEVVIPALEELHYAGRRLVDLIYEIVSPNTCDSKSHSDTINGYLFEIEQNVIRARHDIVDAVVANFHIYINELANRVGETLLLQCFSKYAELRDEIDKANEFIILSREERRRRAKIYDDLWDDYLPKINALFKEIRASQPRIEAEIRQDEEYTKSEWRRQRVRDTVAFVSLLLGLLGLAVGYYFWQSPSTP